MNGRSEDVQAEPVGQVSGDKLATDAVARFVQRRGEGAEAALTGRHRDDPAADAALAGEPDLVEPVARGLIPTSARRVVGCGRSSGSSRVKVPSTFASVSRTQRRPAVRSTSSQRRARSSPCRSPVPSAGMPGCVCFSCGCGLNGVAASRSLPPQWGPCHCDRVWVRRGRLPRVGCTRDQRVHKGSACNPTAR